MKPVSEEALHVAVVSFLRTTLPENCSWFHVPNSLRTSYRNAARHKAMGMKAGVSDLVFCYGGRHYEIELKKPGSYQTKKQKDWQAGIEAAGGKYAVCKSLEDVNRVLLSWGFKLRGRLA